MDSVRPVLSEADLGKAAWRALHEEARERGRLPSKQALELIKFALHRRLLGEDTELSATAREQLRGGPEVLTR